MTKIPGETAYTAIYRVVRRIPAGRVATYGAVAAGAGLPGQARLVGYALHRCPQGQRIPWQRVVNARGMISRLPDPDAAAGQRVLLESEGIEFDARGAIDLARFGWHDAETR
ncbi:MGMT family protein [bacterium]|nr:MGMT family protein [bacterium]